MFWKIFALLVFLYIAFMVLVITGYVIMRGKKDDGERISRTRNEDK